LKVIKQIGAGGFGNVDLVEDQDGNKFARKTFAQNQPLDAALLDNVIKRFAKEARIQGGINHPNIVPVLSSNLTAQPPHYTMPLAESSLADDLQKDPTLGGNVVAALSDIAAALEELHAMQIYHRDLKPQNVLRFKKGDGSGQYYYAVSDFGLISMKESRLSLLTSTGMSKSSDYYTAPEITKELRKASIQSDIFSFGCILHDMVGTDDRVPLHEIKEKGEFAAILRGCTRSDPSQRFKSIGGVLDAILSVGYTPTTPPSQESVNFIGVLEADSPPDVAFWGRLADFLEGDAEAADKDAIFGKMGVERIQTACTAAPDNAVRIGIEFAQWVARTAFNFDYCDALANRLEAFFDGTDFECKVECLMALLSMGTSHNRWFVERKFIRLASPEMDENLAKRLAVEFRIGGDEVCGQINHLENSISFGRSDLHPALVKALADICK
jgi:hypothetical protein